MCVIGKLRASAAAVCLPTFQTAWEEICMLQMVITEYPSSCHKLSRCTYDKFIYCTHTLTGAPMQVDTHIYALVMNA